MKPRVLRNWIWLVPLAAVLWALLLSPLWGAAPTPTLYIRPSIATRMDPAPVFACIDCGRKRYPIAGATLGGWTNTSGSEYRLDATLASLSVSGSTPTNIRVCTGPTTQTNLSEGTVGALAQGEWGASGGYLYVRLADDGDPEADAISSLLIEFDISTTGDSEGYELCTVEWKATGGTWSTIVPGRYTTDPRSQLGGKQIDMSGTVTSHANRPQGTSIGLLLGPGEWTIEATVTNSSGDDATVSATVTVASNSRTESTVGSGGDYADFAEAVSAVGASSNNIQLTLLDGGSETVTGSADVPAITGDNWLLAKASGASDYAITTNTTDSINVLECTGENFVAYGITVADTNNGAQSVNLARAGNNAALVGLSTTTLLNRGFVPNADGLLVLNCTIYGTSTNCTYIADGSEYGENQIMLCGLTAGDSVDENVVRFSTQDHYINVSWCDLTADAKACIRLYQGGWISCYGNQFNGGTTNIGRGDLGVSGAGMRLEANEWIDVYIQISSIDQLAFVNNYVNGGTRLEVEDGGLTSDNITIAHNLLYARDILYIGVTDETLYTNCRYACNAFTPYTDPQATWLDLGDDAVTISSNQFGSESAATMFGRVRIGGSIARNLTSVADLNAETFATGNVLDAFTIGSNLLLSSQQTVTTEPGVRFDYYGNERAAASYAGAAIASDPASSYPTFQAIIPGVLIQEP